MERPSEENLRQMPYSELRKYARQSGIKGSRKAADLIASILGKETLDDSFVTMERTIINSCSKFKEEKFNKDKLIASATPRRETYTVDCPLDDIVKELIITSASPQLRKSLNINDSLNVTMTRGSEKKSKKRKVSFVTPARRSMRLSTLTPQFASVKDRPKTPIPSRSSSGKKKTPNTHEKKSTKVSLTPYNMSGQGRRSKVSGGGKEKRSSTPLPKQKRMKLKSRGSTEESFATDSSTLTTEHMPLLMEVESGKCTPMSDMKRIATPGPASVTKRNIASPLSNKKRAATPVPAYKFKRTTPSMSNIKKNTTPRASATKAKATATPMSNTKKNTSPRASATKAKVTATPNFDQLHQKAFDKMESIEEYQKRKAAFSAKKLNEQKRFQDRVKAVKATKMSKIPKKFGGIPFIPSVTSIRDIKTNFSLFNQETNSLPHKKTVTSVSQNESAMSKKVPFAGVKILRSVSCENTPLRKKTKFDIQASLSKKLPYKPHLGPLKPLSVQNLSLTLPIGAQQKETENPMVRAKRIQSRTIVKGVRTNRRFELQMKNRKATFTKA